MKEPTWTELAEQYWKAGSYDPSLVKWMGSLQPQNREQLLRLVNDYGRDHEHPFANVSKIHSLVGWAHYNFNVFRLTHSLTTSLLLTSLDDEIPRLPFDAFRIDLPNNLVRSRTGLRFIQQIFIHKWEGDEGARLNIDLIYDSGELAFITRPLSELDMSSASSEWTDEAGTCIHILRGLCSFLESKTEDVEIHTRARRFTQKPRLNIFEIGRTVTISPELRKLVASGYSDQIWRLGHRYIVRGHWRNQPYGPGRAERRKTWIEPHWKGPEGAEAWRHVYECQIP
jgi:hypothetical protein